MPFALEVQGHVQDMERNTINFEILSRVDSGEEVIRDVWVPSAQRLCTTLAGVVCTCLNEPRDIRNCCILKVFQKRVFNWFAANEAVVAVRKNQDSGLLHCLVQREAVQLSSSC